MSTSAVSSQSIYQELQSFYQNRQSDVSQLGSALQSGDLAGAQQAFSELVALGQGGPFANTEPFSKSGRVQDFETIGQDLQAGDLAGAQAAFAALTSKQSNSAAQTTAAAVVNLSATAPSNGTTPGSEPSIYQQLEAYRQQRQADLAQLGQDLQAGNVNAARQDFNTLAALGQDGPHADGQLFEQTDRAQDFQTIGAALQTGNISLAQSAFSSLASTFGGQNLLAQSAINAYGGGSQTSPPVVQNPGETSPPVFQGPPTSPPVTKPPVTAPPPVQRRTTLPHIVRAEPVGPRRAQGPSALPPSNGTTSGGASGSEATS